MKIARNFKKIIGIVSKFLIQIRLENYNAAL